MTEHEAWPPPWFDPERYATLTPHNVQALAHPIRFALLRLLREDGPATASGLAQRVGHSSGVTSYHLRTLADAGLVVEDEELGNRRDRWWKAAHENVTFTLRVPDQQGDAEQLETAARYLRMVAQVGHERVLGYVNGLPERGEEVAELPWQLGYIDLSLTYAEARELSARVVEAVAAFRRDQSGRARGPGGPDADGPERHRAVFQYQLLPDDDDAAGAAGARE
ncbi:ArsR/SmtB family transcription factor [Promicromonospora sp. NPDC057488]|uniref:ArsR/SmtB family transcription factor n=1 Tax=Promicromonospora sp. NPDC057488 TaxID=3346147 RepID=UPI003670D9F6